MYKIGMIGLGYVGLPLAVELAKVYDVVGFDVSESKVALYKEGIDVTNEVGDEAVKNSTLKFSCNQDDLKNCNFYIVAVPTPVDSSCEPQMGILESASKTVGEVISKGDVVVYESTVYPGATEEICAPILAQYSGLEIYKDIKLAYSPERINPGDTVNNVRSIIKVISAQDDETLEKLVDVYSVVVDAGLYRASGIKVAEAAKVIENSQRDINIAFMNEIAQIFDKLDIDTKEVLQAAGSKWNFLKFEPGLVGGHCIGVDPYYLAHKAKEVGINPNVILSGRNINDGMVRFIYDKIIDLLMERDKKIDNPKVSILGITFKENCNDSRNSKMVKLWEELNKISDNINVFDPHVEKKDIPNIKLSNPKELKGADIVIIGVKHDEISLELVKDIVSDDTIIIDIKSMFNFGDFKGTYWRL